MENLLSRNSSRFAKTKGEGWVDYMYPKPARIEKTRKERILSKKITYVYRVPGTDMFVSAACGNRWGNPCGFKSRLRHHRNTQREFGLRAKFPFFVKSSPMADLAPGTTRGLAADKSSRVESDYSRMMKADPSPMWIVQWPPYLTSDAPVGLCDIFHSRACLSRGRLFPFRNIFSGCPWKNVSFNMFAGPIACNIFFASGVSATSVFPSM